MAKCQVQKVARDALSIRKSFVAKVLEVPQTQCGGFLDFPCSFALTGCGRYCATLSSLTGGLWRPTAQLDVSRRGVITESIFLQCLGTSRRV